MADRKLYEACKYQVRANPGDCGMTLAELWHTIHHDPERGFFWYRMTLAEYQDYLEKTPEWKLGDHQTRVLDDLYHQNDRDTKAKERKKYCVPEPREDLRYKQGGRW